MSSGRVIKLRDGAKGPVFGVRVQVDCRACGLAYYQTLTIGIDRPAIWCPQCRHRGHLRIKWDMRTTPKAGQIVRWREE